MNFNRNVTCYSASTVTLVLCENVYLLSWIFCVCRCSSLYSQETIEFLTFSTVYFDNSATERNKKNWKLYMSKIIRSNNNWFCVLVRYACMHSGLIYIVAHSVLRFCFIYFILYIFFFNLSGLVSMWVYITYKRKCGKNSMHKLS